MILPAEVRAAVAGPDVFATALLAQRVETVRVDWRPAPAAVTDALRRLLGDDRLYRRMTAANEEAMRRITTARCVLVDIRQARDVIPGMTDRMLLHAGPPLTWSRACGPMRGALAGAVLYEGWTRSVEDAMTALARGEFQLEACHEHDTVGPMAGVVSPSMPVFVVENETSGNRAFSTLNEGLGKVLRYGANDRGVIARLRWLTTEVTPALATAVRRAGVDLTSIASQALHMGDEMHNRNKAATALFTRALAPHLVDVDGRRKEATSLGDIFRYLAETDVFFLNLAMAAAKAALDPAVGIAGSTVVTAMARNGTDFGIRVSGTGEAWFTAPAPRVDGLYFPGFGPEDANPDIGDSAITETGGLGAFALAAAPAITQFIGGTPALARQYTDEMYGITLAEHPRFTIPALDFRGTPVGIDCLAVARSRVSPVLDTGIAHREPGIGQIGAGLVRTPIAPFDAALVRLAGE
ncbi:MAG TPA: DUF1116 domain-containing protein [Chloroflexota bacterium]|nr:DUF1116 domain-containing protein [Chloroflexota bacterium]